MNSERWLLSAFIQRRTLSLRRGVPLCFLVVHCSLLSAAVSCADRDTRPGPGPSRAVGEAPDQAHRLGESWMCCLQGKRCLKGALGQSLGWKWGRAGRRGRRRVRVSPPGSPPEQPSVPEQSHLLWASDPALG